MTLTNLVHQLKGSPVSAQGKQQVSMPGLPPMPTNSTESDGTYNYENLIQGLIQNMVTGNGNGPVLSRSFYSGSYPGRVAT